MEQKLTDLLGDMHKSLAQELLARIKSGEATAAELAAAIKFLKDNGIDAEAQRSEPLMNLAAVLPFDPEASVEEAS